jgi:hypothetical protein
MELFDGRREKFRKRKFMEKGLDSIATNKTPRPIDIDEGAYYQDKLKN